MARSITSVMLACHLLIGLFTAYRGRPWGLDLTVEAFFVAGVLTTGYLRTSPGAPHRRRSRRIATLTAQEVCIVSPRAFLGHDRGTDTEFRAGSRLLPAAAGMEATVTDRRGPLLRAQDAVLAGALRVGVTGMLRHGRALESVQRRACAAGGPVSTRAADGSRFHLVVPALLGNAQRRAADRSAGGGAGPAARPMGCSTRSPEQPVS
ncbi:hypothetical protein [Actinacidiphila paucisporea]|nr:hypothetical protein [Actinacidiphila paucisporea]